MAIFGSDTTSETDSQPPTAGTSLLDVSHRQPGGVGGQGSRKRSSSRTSLGSRGKSLQLTLDQKCGIAGKELERIGAELAEFRADSRRENREAAAEVDERTLKIEEMEISRALLAKGIEKSRLPKKTRDEDVRFRN